MLAIGFDILQIGIFFTYQGKENFMTVHLYLSLIPEALIASMLPPDEFGMYYAVGSHKKQHGQAVFAELEPDFRNDYFKIEKGLERCVPHEDGRPKRSVYISTYRVLEQVPLEAIKKLYLVTAYGEVLGLDPSNDLPEKSYGLHMYQELAPVSPLVVSSLGPIDFYKFVTRDPDSLIHLPAISFVELQLGELATDPEFGELRDLPYANVNHLRECLLEVQEKEVQTKMVNRVQSPEFMYRTIASGLFVGNQSGLVSFPLPSREALRSTYYHWWRSANAAV
jgi:hypothetical protein